MKNNSITYILINNMLYSLEYILSCFFQEYKINITIVVVIINNTDYVIFNLELWEISQSQQSYPK